MTNDLNKQLIKICINGDLDALKKLVADGADPAYDGNWPIRLAAGNGHLNMVKYLLTFPNVNPAACLNYAVNWAARNGDLNMVKYLVTLPNVNPADYYNLALRWAAEYGHLAVVEFLCNLPSVNPVDYDNYAMNMAVENKHLHVFQFLVQECIRRKYFDADKIHICCLSGNLDAVKNHINNGIDVNAVDNSGWTLLIWAVHGNMIDVCKELIKHGADVNFTTKNGHSAKKMASFWGNDDILKLLNETKQ